MKINSENVSKNVKALILLNLFIGFALLSSLSVQAQKTITEPYFYGTWITKVNEPVDGKCKIKVVWKEDNTTEIQFIYKNKLPYVTKSVWTYKDGLYQEIYEDGGEGKASIRWINDNKFALTIIENQATNLYKGKVRIYKRSRK